MAPATYIDVDPADWITATGKFYSMRGKPGDLAAFLLPSADAASVLAERVRLIEAHPQRHARVDDIAPNRWERARSSASRLGLKLAETPMAFSCTHEPDWIWVDRSQADPLFLAASVCFPSGWRPEEAHGRRVSEVHAVVPGLNDALGSAIARFLGRLPVDQCWERLNWGLAPSAQLNRHPDSDPAAFPSSAADDSAIFLRTEHHLFWALSPEDLLFLIRIAHHRWEELPVDTRAAVEGQIRQMSPDLRAYKGIPEELLPRLT